MVPSVINSIRVFKGLYHLAFLEDQFYVEQRAEFLGGVRHCIKQAKEVIAILCRRRYTSGSHSKSCLAS